MRVGGTANTFGFSFGFGGSGGFGDGTARYCGEDRPNDCAELGCRNGGYGGERHFCVHEA
jgi:hypothetical protein